MLIRIFLFITGLASFLYFIFPSGFEKFMPKEGEVLGINDINAQVNKPTIKTILLAYCISEGKLPDDLNSLYDNYLMDEKKLDLDELFIYDKVDDKDCTYHLFPRRG